MDHVRSVRQIDRGTFEICITAQTEPVGWVWSDREGPADMSYNERWALCPSFPPIRQGNTPVTLLFRRLDLELEHDENAFKQYVASQSNPPVVYYSHGVSVSDFQP